MTIYAANESNVLVNGEPIRGVRAIEFRTTTARNDLYAVGSSERIGVITGQRAVEGRIRVASTAPALDALVGDEFFQIAAPLRQGENETTVSIDECLLTDTTFAMDAGGHGETVYAFTATRIRGGG